MANAPELYPLSFDPLFKERVWGGQGLARLYGKRLPPGRLVGESWELSDRHDAVSVINNGPLAGRSLRWLLEKHGTQVLGAARALNGRFPLLIKIIDAHSPLSLQVHPPEHLAASLGGESKSELWYVAQARSGAQLFAGLKRRITRDEFAKKIADGTVMECVHSITVTAGDVMLVPAGRVHAIGGSIVVVEIQQNSDTTYRVFDWDRTARGAASRRLHVEQALRCIDFDDVTPALAGSGKSAEGIPISAGNDAFQVEVSALGAPREIATEGACVVLGSVAGTFTVRSGTAQTLVAAGSFCLVPACLAKVALRGEAGTKLICVRTRAAPAAGRSITSREVHPTAGGPAPPAPDSGYPPA